MSRRAVWTAALTTWAAIAACAGGAAQGPAPVVRCEVGDSTMVRDVLYFGRSRPAGGTVSDAEWQAFLSEVVTPRFPAGLTVVAATGQWRGENGTVEQEQSEIMTLFHAGDDAARRGVEEVMAELPDEPVYRDARQVFERVALREIFVEFLTLTAYAQLLGHPVHEAGRVDV